MSEKYEIDPQLGLEINGPGRQYFENVVIDNMMDALVELSAVLWTVRDRQIVLEKVLAEQGIDADTLIESYVPDAQELEARALERDAVVKRIFRSFNRRPQDGAAKSADVTSLREIKE